MSRINHESMLMLMIINRIWKEDFKLFSNPDWHLKQDYSFTILCGVKVHGMNDFFETMDPCFEDPVVRDPLFQNTARSSDMTLHFATITCWMTAKAMTSAIDREIFFSYSFVKSLNREWGKMIGKVLKKFWHPFNAWLKKSFFFFCASEIACYLTLPQPPKLSKLRQDTRKQIAHDTHDVANNRHPPKKINMISHDNSHHCMSMIWPIFWSKKQSHSYISPFKPQKHNSPVAPSSGSFKTLMHVTLFCAIIVIYLEVIAFIWLCLPVS